jgi:hypothetical protein
MLKKIKPSLYEIINVPGTLYSNITQRHVNNNPLLNCVYLNESLENFLILLTT